MNARVLLALALLGLIANTNSTVILTTTTATASALATGAAALGVGALAVVKGTLLARALKRGKRDLTPQQEDEAIEIALDVASQMDSYGCITKLLCEIEAIPEPELTQNMVVLKKSFANHALKISRGTFGMAISFGSKIAKGNPKACDRLFDQCPLPKEELVAMLDSTLNC